MRKVFDTQSLTTWIRIYSKKKSKIRNYIIFQKYNPRIILWSVYINLKIWNFLSLCLYLYPTFFWMYWYSQYWSYRQFSAKFGVNFKRLLSRCSFLLLLTLTHLCRSHVNWKLRHIIIQKIDKCLSNFNYYYIQSKYLLLLMKNI